jgi:CRP/FNR family nitrogen fixation transcriptional regulator
MHKDARERPSSRELDALAGESVFCSEFKYRPGTEIFGEAEPVEYIYQVIDGAVRSYKLLSDGRRQINAFHLPGDIFGVENGNVHRFTAEAIIETNPAREAPEDLWRAGTRDEQRPEADYQEPSAR